MSIRKLENGNYEFYYTITDSDGVLECNCPNAIKGGNKNCKYIQDTIKQFNLNPKQSSKKPKGEGFEDETIPF